MDIIFTAFAFLCGYLLRDLIGKACLAGALTRIEQRLGTGTFDRGPADAAARRLNPQSLEDKARQVH